MTVPVPPRRGSVRAAILAVLPEDGSPMSRAELLKALPMHKYGSIASALNDGARGRSQVVVREDRPDGVFYRRTPEWVGRPVRTTPFASCLACGGVIREVAPERRCAGHRPPSG